ncbi:Protein of uncharacterised function DUF262 [Buttiauxella agrestis]|uniref:Protein of uncharacterized function DUF262 n=1 Tax=Buttiauxella agrestis TaxID=82977 RepID=A0A381KNC3_9ENTR|nr:DUF262 domain-containing protein [Buttiauxella agrestis]SUY92874.1 Protein of uncharacterised function DUF262 [Buttiauxella agrestis]
MEHRLTGLQRFSPAVSIIQIDSYIHWMAHGALSFDAEYQREYVWGHAEQQAFLATAASGFPLGHVALCRLPDWGNIDGPYIEVVDGKQRLVTMKLFVNDQIAFCHQGKEFYWSDLNRTERRIFTNASLPAIKLDDANLRQRLEFFYTTNFTGVPQSCDHKRRVSEMLHAAGK